MLDQIAKWVSTNTWGIILLATAAIVSLAMTAWALYLTIRSNRSKQPRYALRNNVLIQGAKVRFPNLTIHYKGIGGDHDDLSVALVAFWNAGRDPIRNIDIAPADPLVICAAENCEILECSVIQADPVNLFEAKVAKKGKEKANAVLITFDHLGHKQGGVIQVLHTGLHPIDLEVRGTIIGGGNPTLDQPSLIPFMVYPRMGRRRTFAARKKTSRMNLAFMLGMNAIMLVVMVCTQFDIPLFDRKLPPEVHQMIIDARPAGFYYYNPGLILGLCYLQWLLYSALKRRVPTSLSKFEEEI
jgi:hypothetical protein